MMGDYTPDTEEVRELYWATSGTPRRDSEAWDEFDRWLRKVKADTLRDFAKTLDTYSGTVLNADNAAILARVKAHQIDRGEDD